MGLNIPVKRCHTLNDITPLDFVEHRFNAFKLKTKINSLEIERYYKV